MGTLQDRALAAATISEQTETERRATVSREYTRAMRDLTVRMMDGFFSIEVDPAQVVVGPLSHIVAHVDAEGFRFHLRRNGTETLAQIKNMHLGISGVCPRVYPLCRDCGTEIQQIANACTTIYHIHEAMVSMGRLIKATEALGWRCDKHRALASQAQRLAAYEAEQEAPVVPPPPDDDFSEIAQNLILGHRFMGWTVSERKRTFTQRYLGMTTTCGFDDAYGMGQVLYRLYTLYRAASVVYLDPQLKAHLKASDPNAYRQLQQALRLVVLGKEVPDAQAGT